jgi:[acyl-carrier-protein] S-malonyltransferase
MHHNKIAILFPGQGSQYIGMGKEFLEDDAGARQLMELAESESSAPIQKISLEGPMEDLTQAVHLQPAMTVINLICWQMVEKAGITPAYFAGHSLGEYSALCASGVLTVEDTLKLVAERGRLSDREGQKNPGGMQAILGLTLDEVEKVLFSLSSDGIVTVANHNLERQVVISGEKEALDEVEGIVAEKGGRAITLNVSVANHSPLIAGAVPDFEEALNSITFSSPSVPVLFNVTADEEHDPEVIRSIMSRQIVSRVRWFEIINNLMAEGVNTFIEVGPKTVLKGLLKKAVPKSSGIRSFQIDNPTTLAKSLDEIATH